MAGEHQRVPRARLRYLLRCAADEARAKRKTHAEVLRQWRRAYQNPPPAHRYSYADVWEVEAALRAIGEEA